MMRDRMVCVCELIDSGMTQPLVNGGRFDAAVGRILSFPTDFDRVLVGFKLQSIEIVVGLHFVAPNLLGGWDRSLTGQVLGFAHNHFAHGFVGFVKGSE